MCVLTVGTLSGSSAVAVRAESTTRLEQVGILREVTGRKRNRLFIYESYLALLQAEQ